MNTMEDVLNQFDTGSNALSDNCVNTDCIKRKLMVREIFSHRIEWTPSLMTGKNKLVGSNVSNNNWIDFSSEKRENRSDEEKIEGIMKRLRECWTIKIDWDKSNEMNWNDLLVKLDS